jgi:hypothetical protein
MKQMTLAVASDAGFEPYRRRTRRDEFLQMMDRIIPWAELCAVVQPHYAKGLGGRPPIGLERMLRMLFVQHWFNLADEACEDALYDMPSLCHFVGIDLGRERAPDGTTLLKFRRLLEDKDLGKHLFAKVGEVLQARGMKVGTGTIVDATIIAAPSSTKNPRNRPLENQANTCPWDGVKTSLTTYAAIFLMPGFPPHHLQVARELKLNLTTPGRYRAAQIFAALGSKGLRSGIALIEKQ